MNIFKNRLIYFAPIAALLIICLLATAFSPAFNPKPKELPIAIVNLDEGVKLQDNTQNIGKTFTDKLKENKDLRETVSFIDVKSEKELKEGFDNKEYYGALIIPKSFSKDATSLTRSEIQKVKMAAGKKKAEAAQKDLMAQVQSGKITPQQAQSIANDMKKQQEQMMAKNKDMMQPVTVKEAVIKIYNNQGASIQAANISETMLTKMAGMLNDNISKQSTAALTKEHIKLTADQAHLLANPVKAEHTVFNKVKDHQAMGNAPMLLFTPIWLGSLVTSVMLYFAFRQANLVSKKDRLIGSLAQLGIAIISALAGGYIAMTYITHILNLDVTNPEAIYLYISIAMFGFIMLILGLMSWLGMAAVPLFMLALFFSMQMLTLPKQMMPEFYQNYLLGWNPFRIYADGLRDLIYLGKDITFNLPMQMYFGLGIFGVVMIIAASQIKKHKGKRAEIPA